MKWGLNFYICNKFLGYVIVVGYGYILSRKVIDREGKKREFKIIR